MGSPVLIDIANGFYQSPSLPFSNQRCVNLYPNIPQAPALTQSSLFDVGGIRQVAAVGYDIRSKSRGGVVFNGVPHIVAGSNLYSIGQLRLPDGTFEYRLQRLGVIDGTGACYFARSRNDLLIISEEGTGYVYNLANRTVTPIIDAGFYANGKPIYPVCVNSYFIVVTDANKAIISALNNPTDWNSLDTITAEADPDAVVAGFNLNNQLYLLGEFTAEAYQTVVTSGVPFQRIDGYLLQVGCSARRSVINVGSRVLWVGRGANERAGVYVFDGSQPQRVSTIAIDNKLNELTADEIEGIFSWSYATNGHVFVGFTSAKATFVFDLQTGRWHERVSIESRGVNRLVEIPCRIQSVITAFNELFVTDVYDGRIGVVDENHPLEYDFALPKYFTTAPLFNLAKPFTLPCVELLAESGVGNEFEPEPKVTLEISRDGVVFENPQSRELGRRAEHGLRQIWYKQGRVATTCVMRVRTAAPVRCRWFGLRLDLKALR